MMIPVVDLFAGPGGLGEGFTAVGKLGGGSCSPFRVVLSYEKDPHAVRTLRFRELYRICRSEERLDDYLDVASRSSGNQDEAAVIQKHGLSDLYLDAGKRVRHITLGPAVRSDVTAAVDAAVGSRPWVLVGGPPCQAYSLVGRARNRGNPNYDPSRDERHHLYEEYLNLLAARRPAVFVLENVKGLLSATVENEWIFGRMLADLSKPGAAVQRGTAGNAQPEYRLYSLATGAELKLNDMNQLSHLADGDAAVTQAADFRATILRMEEYGAPQARHRVIILGVRADLVERHNLRVKPLTVRQTATVADVISDLPALRSRLSDVSDSRDAWRSFARSVPIARWRRELLQAGPKATVSRVLPSVERLLKESPLPRADVGAPYIPAAVRSRRSAAWLRSPSGKNLGSYWREWFRGDLRNGFGVANHESRGHMREDLHRYIFAATYAWLNGSASPRIRDFPRTLHPKHRNVERALETNHFGDRFRVQLAFRPSSTITSHIHKDGHYYIHFDPTQARSLTVREAARLQTFPDSYVFLGPRTEQYRQVGNAVPPYVGAQIAEVVLDILQQAGFA